MNLKRKMFLIAGPCAAESEEQLMTTAWHIKEEMAKIDMPIFCFRAGVWKSRSSPFDFDGAGNRALKWMHKIEQKLDLRSCVEVTHPDQVKWCNEEGIGAFWIGSRTTVNPFLMQEIADALRGSSALVMVKNPIVPDLKLWIGAIERLKIAGVENIMAIHRGFTERSENVLRNAPAWEIPIEFRTHFPEIPLICDPSHIAGNSQYIKSVATEALSLGFDGLMIETHSNPIEALSDSCQQITPKELAQLLMHLDLNNDEHSPSELAQLHKEREQLEFIDRQIAQLLAKRMTVIDAISKLKKKNHLPIIQPNQWQKVVEHYMESSLPDEHYQRFITKFLALLHTNSIKRQNR